MFLKSMMKLFKSIMKFLLNIIIVLQKHNDDFVA